MSCTVIVPLRLVVRKAAGQTQVRSPAADPAGDGAAGAGRSASPAGAGIRLGVPRGVARAQHHDIERPVRALHDVVVAVEQPCDQARGRPIEASGDAGRARLALLEAQSAILPRANRTSWTEASCISICSALAGPSRMISAWAGNAVAAPPKSRAASRVSKKQWNELPGDASSWPPVGIASLPPFASWTNFRVGPADLRARATRERVGARASCRRRQKTGQLVC